MTRYHGCAGKRAVWPVAVPARQGHYCHWVLGRQPKPLKVWVLIQVSGGRCVRGRGAIHAVTSQWINIVVQKQSQIIFRWKIYSVAGCTYLFPICTYVIWGIKLHLLKKTSSIWETETLQAKTECYIDKIACQQENRELFLKLFS